MGTLTRREPNLYRSGRAGRVSMRADSRLHRRQLVPELFLLRLQISARRLVRRYLERDPFADRQAVAFDADQLARIVAQQPHRAHAELAENLHADAVVALIRLEAEALVRLHRVEALVLQLVGANLVREPDAASFLVQIEEHAAPLVRDLPHRRIELRAAVA